MNFCGSKYDDGDDNQLLYGEGSRNDFSVYIVCQTLERAHESRGVD